MFFLAIVVMVARRPDIVTNAQFWAEDGADWYADAVNDGPLRVLFLPHTGYLQTISRLTFGVASFLPIQWVPLFANSVGLLVRGALVAFFLSPRFSWVDWRAKVAITAYYLLMPNITEVHANITNTQWYLGLYLLLVVLAEPAEGRAWKVHDFVVLLVAGLSGPFIAFALPCFVIRDIWPNLSTRRYRAAVGAALTLFNLVAGALTCLQVGLTVFSDARLHSPLGASADTLARMMATRIVGGAFIPESWTVAVLDHLLPVVFLCLFAVAIAAFVLAKAGWRGVCLLLFPTLLIVASLASPVVDLQKPQWPQLIMVGGRYFVLPSLVWVAALVYAIALSGTERNPLWWLAAVPALAGILPAFAIPPTTANRYGDSIAPYLRAPVGTQVTVPIAPDGWSMTITKR